MRKIPNSKSPSMFSTNDFPQKLSHELKTHHGPINTVIFSSYPGTYILTGSTDRAIHLSRALPSQYSSSSSSNTGASLAKTLSPIQRYEAHGYSVLDIAVARDNSRFASVGGDRQVFLWDVETGSTLRRWTGHMSRIEAVDFGGEEDSIVVSGSADTTISLWDTKSSSSTKPIQTLTEATDTVSSLHAHMPTYSIASGSYDGRVRIYDLRMGRTTVDVLTHPITSVKCSVDGNAILVSSLDGRIRLLDRLDGKLLKAFPHDSVGGGNDDTRKDTKARYRNSSLRIRSVFACGDAVVLSGSESANLEPASAAAGVIPKSQSASLTNADEKDQAHVFAWDILTGEVTATVPAGLGVKVVSCVAWNEKGKCWAAACADGTVKIYS